MTAKPPKLKPRVLGGDSYQALTDPALSTFLSKPQMQKHLLSSGLIDEHGRVVPDDAFRTAAAQRQSGKSVSEDVLAREEAEIRARVQRFRLQQLEQERRVKVAALMREQARIREEIVRLSKSLAEATAGGGSGFDAEAHRPRSRGDSRGGSRGVSPSHASFAHAPASASSSVVGRSPPRDAGYAGSGGALSPLSPHASLLEREAGSLYFPPETGLPIREINEANEAHEASALAAVAAAAAAAANAALDSISGAAGKRPGPGAPAAAAPTSTGSSSSFGVKTGFADGPSRGPAMLGEKQRGPLSATATGAPAAATSMASVGSASRAAKRVPPSSADILEAGGTLPCSAGRNGTSTTSVKPRSVLSAAGSSTIAKPSQGQGQGQRHGFLAAEASMDSTGTSGTGTAGGGAARGTGTGTGTGTGSGSARAESAPGRGFGGSRRDRLNAAASAAGASSGSAAPAVAGGGVSPAGSGIGGVNGGGRGGGMSKERDGAGAFPPTLALKESLASAPSAGFGSERSPPTSPLAASPYSQPQRFPRYAVPGSARPASTSDVRARSASASPLTGAASSGAGIGAAPAGSAAGPMSPGTGAGHGAAFGPGQTMPRAVAAERVVVTSGGVAPSASSYGPYASSTGSSSYGNANTNTFTSVAGAGGGPQAGSSSSSASFGYVYPSARSDTSNGTWRRELPFPTSIGPLPPAAASTAGIPGFPFQSSGRPGPLGAPYSTAAGTSATGSLPMSMPALDEGFMAALIERTLSAHGLSRSSAAIATSPTSASQAGSASSSSALAGLGLPAPTNAATSMSLARAQAATAATHAHLAASASRETGSGSTGGPSSAASAAADSISSSAASAASAIAAKYTSAFAHSAGLLSSSSSNSNSGASASGQAAGATGGGPGSGSLSARSTDAGGAGSSSAYTQVAGTMHRADFAALPGAIGSAIRNAIGAGVAAGSISARGGSSGGSSSTRSQAANPATAASATGAAALPVPLSVSDEMLAKLAAASAARGIGDLDAAAPDSVTFARKDKDKTAAGAGAAAQSAV